MTLKMRKEEVDKKPIRQQGQTFLSLTNLINIRSATTHSFSDFRHFILVKRTLNACRCP